MDLVKKNIVSVICGVVAIVAIAASFFPLGGYISDLQGSLDTSKSTYSTVEGLLPEKKPRTLPILKLDETTPQPLPMFPSKDVIDKASAVVKEVSAQSIKMRDAAIAMNQRPLLVARSLPAPTPQEEIAFRNQYGALVSPPMQGPTPSGGPPPLLAEFKGGVLPQQAAIEMERQRRLREIQETKVQKDFRGQIINQPEIAELNAQATAGAPVELRQAVANKSLFYVEVLPQNGGPTLDIAPGIIGTGRPKLEAIWWAQVALWIQRDVLTAMREVNTAPLENGKVPANLMEAPVKRVQRIAIPMTQNMFVTAAGQAAAAADPTVAADAALPKVVQASPTGRVSNGMYDVVHFQIHADIEVDKIPQVLRTISHNRLMSVYHVDAKAVDATQAELAGYYYGSKPVATVTMHCEALLLRNWTAPLMPKAIRAILQIPDPPVPGATVPGAAPAETPAPTAWAQ